MHFATARIVFTSGRWVLLRELRQGGTRPQQAAARCRQRRRQQERCWTGWPRRAPSPSSQQSAQQTSEGFPMRRQFWLPVSPQPGPSLAKPDREHASRGCYSHVALMSVYSVEQSLWGHPLHRQATLGHKQAPHQPRAARERGDRGGASPARPWHHQHGLGHRQHRECCCPRPPLTFVVFL